LYIVSLIIDLLMMIDEDEDEDEELNIVVIAFYMIAYPYV
jgi:hypothetical protein